MTHPHRPALSCKKITVICPRVWTICGPHCHGTFLLSRLIDRFKRSFSVVGSGYCAVGRMAWRYCSLLEGGTQSCCFLLIRPSEIYIIYWPAQVQNVLSAIDMANSTMSAWKSIQQVPFQNLDFLLEMASAPGMMSRPCLSRLGTLLLHDDGMDSTCGARDSSTLTNVSDGMQRDWQGSRNGMQGRPGRELVRYACGYGLQWDTGRFRLQVYRVMTRTFLLINQDKKDSQPTLHVEIRRPGLARNKITVPSGSARFPSAYRVRASGIF